MNSLHISLQPQTILAVRFASLPRQRSNGYASSGELANRARQNCFHLTDLDMQGVH